MWRFPKMGVPPNYSFNLDVAFHYKLNDKPSSYWGTPLSGKLHVDTK
jgi:hypothetical protein